MTAFFSSDKIWVPSKLKIKRDANTTRLRLHQTALHCKYEPALYHIFFLIQTSPYQQHIHNIPTHPGSYLCTFQKRREEKRRRQFMRLCIHMHICHLSFPCSPTHNRMQSLCKGLWGVWEGIQTKPWGHNSTSSARMMCAVWAESESGNN